MNEKTEKPLVSVIIPTFDRGQVIKEAVDSVLAQTFRDFELIVVDDGSTDNTQEILRSYGEAVCVIYQENRGVSAARNAGIAAASGDFIALLDSDDLWLPEKLSVQTAFFRDNPDIEICQTGEIWIRNGVRVNPKKKHQKLSGMIFGPSLALCLVSPSAVMMRRSLFERVGLFDENLPACEDYDLWLRISLHDPVFLIDQPLVVKRGGHEDQLSATPGLDRYRIESIRKLLDAGAVSGKQRRAAEATLREKCRVYANGCRKRGRNVEADFHEALARRFPEIS